MLKRCFRNSVLIAASLFVTVAAAGASLPVKKEREPMVITSDTMEADKLGDVVTFTGNVVLKKENLTLSSDRMIVFYEAGTKSIREIDASGNVVVQKAGRVALSSHASYYSREEKIVLTGNARIIENENQLGGEKITLFMRDDRSIVEGGKMLLYKDERGNPIENPKRK
jgi:lipopolysaccharide export system protein LptA